MGRTNNSNNNKKDAIRRRPAGRRTAIDNFASGGVGVTKAIQDFRKRKDKKRTETAKALRRYKKTMKQEGYEPGMGASRKRPPTTTTSNEDDDDDNANQQQQHTHQRDSNNKKKKRMKKSNPFTKSLEKAQENQSKRNDLEKQREANEKERQLKIKQRRKRTKQLRQRTSRGQPVMKHMITDILRKLQNDNEEEEKGKK